MEKSNFASLDTYDIIKGLIVAIIGAVLGYVQSIAESGSLTDINWQVVLTLAVGAGASYLVKNFFSNSKDQPFSAEKK